MAKNLKTQENSSSASTSQQVLQFGVRTRSTSTKGKFQKPKQGFIAKVPEPKQSSFNFVSSNNQSLQSPKNQIIPPQQQSVPNQVSPQRVFELKLQEPTSPLLQNYPSVTFDNDSDNKLDNQIFDSCNNSVVEGKQQPPKEHKLDERNSKIESRQELGPVQSKSCLDLLMSLLVTILYCSVAAASVFAVTKVSQQYLAYQESQKVMESQEKVVQMKKTIEDLTDQLKQRESQLLIMEDIYNKEHLFEVQIDPNQPGFLPPLLEPSMMCGYQIPCRSLYDARRMIDIQMTDSSNKQIFAYDSFKQTLMCHNVENLIKEINK